MRSNNRKANIPIKVRRWQIKVIGSCEEQQKLFGWCISVKDELVSHISRRSTDILREYYIKYCLLKSGTWLKVEREGFHDNLISGASAMYF